MTPAQNLAALRANPYPGRGICVGLDENGAHILQVYWIMGRSVNSRNRVFVAEGGSLRTAAADPSQLKDPTNVIYNAMRELKQVYVVTNGNHTDTIYDAIAAGGTFVEALNTRTYEPDAPNSTARISCVCDLRSGQAVTELSVVKKSACSDAPERQFFQYEALPRGAGYTITTYTGDGDPLPRFEGEPYLLPLVGGPQKVLETIWGALNAENRVSIALKSIEAATGKSRISVINAYAQTKR